MSVEALEAGAFARHPYIFLLQQIEFELIWLTPPTVCLSSVYLTLSLHVTRSPRPEKEGKIHSSEKCAT